MSELDLAKVLPLGRQHSLFNGLEVVLKNMGHLIHQYLPEILQILLCMTAVVSSILQQREKVQYMQMIYKQTCKLNSFPSFSPSLAHVHTPSLVQVKISLMPAWSEV